MTHEEAAERIELARKAKNTGEYDTAERLANEILSQTEPNEEHHANAMFVLVESARLQGNFEAARNYGEVTLQLAETHGHAGVRSAAYNSLGSTYWILGDYTKSLEYLGHSLSALEELGDTYRMAAVMGNIAAVYAEMGDFAKSIEYSLKCMAAFELLGDTSNIARATGNTGLSYLYLGESEKALEYFRSAIAVHDELGEKYMSARINGNIGMLYAKHGDYQLALDYHSRSLAVSIEVGDKRNIAVATTNIGAIYAAEEFEGHDYQTAEEYLQKAISLCIETGEKRSLYEIYQQLSALYQSQGRWEESLLQFKKYHDIEKEVQSEEAKKKADMMEQSRQAAERDKGLAIERAKHEATEQLLHNVLPPSIAHRMIKGESLIAEKLEQVSVLFADIVNFTNLSQRITAEELVAGLDRIFSTFDALAEKHGLEKIKTIGDAYMVVSGAPLPRADHAEAMAQMAIEMMESMKQFRSISTGEEVQIRIGIHSGEVVAGVIGKKKFAYDLWGDAVNTASRMESHGEPGKIHVSEEFVSALVGTGRDVSLQEDAIHFIERGEMEIKGKGLMTTYFLEYSTKVVL